MRQTESFPAALRLEPGTIKVVDLSQAELTVRLLEVMYNSRRPVDMPIDEILDDLKSLDQAMFELTTALSKQALAYFVECMNNPTVERMQ